MIFLKFFFQLPTWDREDAIQGVTLDLQESGNSTVVVQRDNDTIRESIIGFVDAYSELKGTTGQLTAFNGEQGGRATDWR